MQRLAEQFRKPEGLAGRVVSLLMERGNRAANEWTLSLLGLGDADDVLEIGFGHGAALALALERSPGGRVAGVDFSETMVRQASRRHAAAIAAGRVRLYLGDLGSLPESESFGRIFAVNVLYFFPDAAAFAQALHARLKPGGRVALFIRPEAELRRMRFPATGGVFRFFAPAEVEALLLGAGFQRAWSETRIVSGGQGHCILAER
ncbi:MAG TPA: class I SAM-dependent methyltransferase [Myxococcales bacterium]